MGGKLCLAPIKKDVQDVIDIGTGTGIWACDFADEYPSAQVIGTDLSPIQPSFVPPNLRFLIDDAEEEWRYDRKFDLVHGRMLTNIKPGGYIEMQDINNPLGCDDDTMPPSTAMYKWSEYLMEACNKLERPCDIAKDHKRRMEKAGFVDVVEVIHKWPQNTWAKDPELKEIGAWTMTNMLQGMQGIAMAPLTRGLGWSREQVERFLVDVRKDVLNRKIHCYWPIYIVYGRKPETAE
ncbi:hypothetical protein FQN50_003362 [Emmonsiellopsis sp. PD_5]|nr:hypothetical protein FQN50_003362 [Emmonsiellopsis sp. PD_5]